MANITEFLRKIKTARKGAEVRDSIHDSIKAMNDEIVEDLGGMIEDGNEVIQNMHDEIQSIEQMKLNGDLNMKPDDLTEEQWANMKTDLTNYYKRYESTYTTTAKNETNIPINIRQYNTLAILEVYIEGRMLTREEYQINGTYSIILNQALSEIGTKVHFVVYRSVCASTEDISKLKGDKGDSGAIVFDTVADMKESTELVAGDTCQTLGYHSVNDGGSGLYQVIAAPLASVDEGSYIALSNNYIAKLIINDTLNPELFGAIGDGATDDTIKLRNMLSVNAPNYVLSKIYKITSALDISNLPQGATITGGGKIYATSSVDGTLKNLFTIANRTNKLTIDDITFTSDSDQVPYMPVGHNARTGALSSNIIALRIDSSENLNLLNLTFENMGFDTHIQGHLFDGNFGCNNINIKNWYSTGGQMGIYADSIDNLYVDNYTMIPAEIGAGGYHILYVAEAIGKARFTNITLVGNETIDVAFDFAGYNNREDINYNADIIVDGFNVTANCLCAIKRHCKNIELRNGSHTQLDKIREDGVRQIGASLSLNHDTDDNNNVVYPTIKLKNVDFKKGSSNQYLAALCFAYSKGFGKYIFENCTIENMPVQDSNVEYRGEVEFYNCKFIDSDALGIYRTFRARSYDTLVSHGTFEFCKIECGGVYPFNTRKDASYGLKVKNCIITNTASVPIVYNANEISGPIEISGNDYSGSGVTTSTFAVHGVGNTSVKQYNNYVAGQLYTA